MDPYHRKSRGEDTRNGRDCQFCQAMDPNFYQRQPIDRMVLSKADDCASAHLTEDGYIKHRLAELARRRSAMGAPGSVSRCA